MLQKHILQRTDYITYLQTRESRLKEGMIGIMSKGEEVVIVTISWVSGLVILALMFMLADADPSDFPGLLLLIVWMLLSKFIHIVLVSIKETKQ